LTFSKLRLEYSPSTIFLKSSQKLVKIWSFERSQIFLNVEISLRTFYFEKFLGKTNSPSFENYIYIACLDTLNK
jgi:hypothetical protein